MFNLSCLIIVKTATYGKGVFYNVYISHYNFRSKYFSLRHVRDVRFCKGCPLLLCDFRRNWNVSTAFSKNLQITYLIKKLSAVHKLFHANWRTEGQTDTAKLTGALFRLSLRMHHSVTHINLEACNVLRVRVRNFGHLNLHSQQFLANRVERNCHKWRKLVLTNG